MRSEKCSPLLAGNQGFTLIELLVALAIGLFLFVMTIGIMDYSVRTYRAQERVADIQQDVRAALSIMTWDIRMAGFDPRRHTNAGIVTADANTIRFRLDANKTDTLDLFDEEDITYAFADGAINRILYYGAGAPFESSTPLLTNVSDLSFVYLDQDGNAAESLDDITAVVISVTCQDRSTQSDKSFERTLTSTVAIRNLAM